MKTILIPHATPGTATPAGGQPRSTAPDGAAQNDRPVPAKILLVDDNLDLLKLLHLVILREGHLVFTATHGGQALTLAKQHDFDLVVTDLLMPVKEGVETILAFQQLHPRTRIIAMSGGGTHASARNYLEIARGLGVVCTLAKPFSRDEFLASVRQVLAAGGRGAAPPLVGVGPKPAPVRS